MAQDISEKIRAAAVAKGIDPTLAVSIAQAESSLRPDVGAKTSSAKGLFGIIDSTWSAFGGKPGQQKDADENIRVGMDIIASNTGYLKNKLGRNPQPSEVYAAHFFGPSGAMAFLSADPNTPMESVFSKKVMDANPQLQRKTTQQIRGMLAKKVGGGSTAVASFSTPATQTQPKSGIQRAVYKAAPLTHPMLAMLGPNYQAAMAVSMLADEGEKEGKDEYEESESAKMLAAAPSRPVALAQADLSFQSPFPEIQKPQQQPIGMAAGGDVSAPDIGDAPARETLARMFANQETVAGMGDMTTAGVGRNFDVGGGNLNIGAALTSMTKDEKQELAKNLMASYTRNIGDATVGMSINKPLDIPADVYQAALMGSMPIGQGRAMILAQGTRVNGQDYPVNQMIGYEHSVGPGQLSFNASQMKDFPESRQYQLQYRMPLGRADGGVVHRAGGSLETGERMTPQQIEQLAADQVALNTYYQPKARPSTGMNRNITYRNGEDTGAFLQGMTELPYDLIGAPRDISNLIMTPFGYGVEKPVMGSAFLKEQATAAGIRPPPPTNPTLRAFYGAGELGAGFMNPAGVVRKGVQVAEAGTAGVKKAADMLRGMKKPKEVSQIARVEPALTPEVQTELAQMGEQRQLPRNAAQAPDPFMGVRPTVAEAQANVAARQAEPLPAPPAEVAVPPEMLVPEVAPVAPPMEATAKVIRPFAGRLDAFIDTIKNPVQLGQLKGQLKGKFRDYDLERVERAFPGMDDKTKLTPDQIKQALAGTHSPSKIIAETIPPTSGKHWQNADNVWGAPLGTTNLYLDQPAEKIALSKLHDEGVLAFGRLTPDSVQYPRIEDVEKTRQFLNREDVAKVIDPEVVNSVNQKLDRAQQNIGLIDQYSSDIRNITQGFTSPVLYKNAEAAQGAHNNQPWFKFVREVREANSQAEVEKFVSQGMTQSEALMEYSRLVSNQEYGKNLAAQADTYAAKKVHELAAADAAKHGIPSPDFSLINWEAHKADVAGAARNTPEFRVSVENVMEPSIQTVHEATKNVKRFLKDDLSKVEQTLFKNRLYEGKHLGVAGRPYPISFTRFSEHAADIPGMGTVQGRHFHELQSDLYNAVTKEGSAYGSLAKDQEELARLNNELWKNTEKSLQQKQEWASQAGSQTTPAEHSNKMREIDKSLTNLNNPLNDRVKIVNRRIIGNAKYNLEEPFANYETSSDVRRQMLIKGAVHSAMKDGKSFATFPGAESTQPQLYVDMETGRSKVYPNLKQVVKDLGGEKAGFDVRPIELPPNKNGKPVTAWGITWSPESAARIVEKGVPFAKGGMVERQSADTRRYL